MPNQSLTDLPERTSTSGSDRIHVNNAGTDYQQTKAKFLVGDLYSVYSNSVSITSTADSLPAPGTYFGYIASYGHQTTVDVPANNNFYVKITRMSNSDYSNIEIWSVNDAEGAHYIRNKVGGSWSNWVQIPHRSEITSLNNSLTNSFLIGSNTDTVSSIANFRLGKNTSEILVIAAWINNINAFCIPFTDANGNWYVKVANWGQSAWSPITSGQITVNYLYKKV